MINKLEMDPSLWTKVFLIEKMLSRGTELFSELRANAVKWKIFSSLMFLNWIVDISAQITSQDVSFALIQTILI